jgi:hypothetical protein
VLVGILTALATLHAADAQFRWWWPTSWMAAPLAIIGMGCLLIIVPVRRTPGGGEADAGRAAKSGAGRPPVHGGDADRALSAAGAADGGPAMENEAAASDRWKAAGLADSRGGSQLNFKRIVRAALAAFAVACVAISAGVAFHQAGRSVPTPTGDHLRTTHPKIITPADGYHTTRTTLDITVNAPSVQRGHQWYLAVQPLREPGAYYLYKAVSTGGTHYAATVGTGPTGKPGIGAYVISLVDADDAAEVAISRETTGNLGHYDMYGMPLPAGAVPVRSIRIIRTG